MDKEKICEFVKQKGKGFYKSYEWVIFRKKTMTKKKFRCEDCWNGGINKKNVRQYKKATVLHHDKPLKRFPQLALTESNMIALCKKCHETRHPEIYVKKTNTYKERWD